MPARIASATARPDALHAEQRLEQAPLAGVGEAVEPQRLVLDEVGVDEQRHRLAGGGQRARPSTR